jgi:hypothetical protein
VSHRGCSIEQLQGGAQGGGLVEGVMYLISAAGGCKELGAEIRRVGGQVRAGGGHEGSWVLTLPNKEALLSQPAREAALSMADTQM